VTKEFKRVDVDPKYVPLPMLHLGGAEGVVDVKEECQVFGTELEAFLKRGGTLRGNGFRIHVDGSGGGCGGEIFIKVGR
jgi:hypothetical protein